MVSMKVSMPAISSGTVVIWLPTGRVSTSISMPMRRLICCTTSR